MCDEQVALYECARGRGSRITVSARQHCVSEAALWEHAHIRESHIEIRPRVGVHGPVGGINCVLIGGTWIVAWVCSPHT